MRGGTATMGRRGKLDQRARPPPTTYSHPQRAGPRVTIGSRRKLVSRKLGGKKRGVLMMPRKMPGTDFTFSMKLATVGFNSSNAFVVQFMSGNVVGGQIYMMPQNSYYFPTMVTNLVSCYSRYRLMQFRLRYRTRMGTQTSSILQCAYFADPGFFEGQSAIANAAQAPSDALLTTASSCTQWPVWRDMDCPWHRSNKLLYVDSTTPSGVFVFTGAVANERQTVAGVYGILGTTNPTLNSAITVGDLYIDMIINCREMVTPQTTGVTFKTTTQRIAELEKKMERLNIPPKNLIVESDDEKDFIRDVLADQKEALRSPTPIKPISKDYFDTPKSSSNKSTKSK